MSKINQKRKKREPLTPESRAEKLEGFEAWLWDMPNALKRFKNRMPPHIQSQLDFSTASLDTVEQHLLSQYPSIDAIMAEPSFILDGYAVYVGETFRKALKDNPLNQWELMLVEDDVFFDLPIINTTNYIDCPLTLVTASLDRRTGHYWSGILNNVLAEQPSFDTPQSESSGSLLILGEKVDSAVMGMPLIWNRTYNIDFPYKTEINQQKYFLRLNNFPEENIYTLVDEMLNVYLELEDLPINWTMEAL